MRAGSSFPPQPLPLNIYGASQDSFPHGMCFQWTKESVHERRDPFPPPPTQETYPEFLKTLFYKWMGPQ